MLLNVKMMPDGHTGKWECGRGGERKKYSEKQWVQTKDGCTLTPHTLDFRWSKSRKLQYIKQEFLQGEEE